MDREQQQLPPGVHLEQDAQFLDRVDSALDRHRQDSNPTPPSVHGIVIHTQGPTLDVGSPATAPAGGEAKQQDGLPKLAGSAATAQFFGAGGPMCVIL